MIDLRILIAGAGSIGSVIGLLLNQKHDVELLRRQPPFGKASLSLLGEVELTGQLTIVSKDDFDKTTSTYDMIIITVQNQQTETICQVLNSCPIYNEQTIFLSLQNGMDTGTLIQQYFPNSPVISGTIWWSAALIDQQTILYHRKAGTVLGILSTSTATNYHLEKVKSVLSEYFETTITDDLITEMRKKLILNVVSPILALVQQPYPEGLNDVNVRNMVHALYDEAIETADLLNWDIDDELDDRLNGFHNLLITGEIPHRNNPTPYTHKVSTQLGMEKYGGEKSNIHALLGWLQLSGSQLADEIIQLVISMKPSYDPINSDTFQLLLDNTKSARCRRLNN